MKNAALDFYLSCQEVEVRAARRTVVRIPELRLCGGTVVHLTGENGAGKTTFLRALTGEAAYRGQLRLAGAVPATVEAKAQTAYVPTDAALLDDLTVAENVAFMARAWGQDERPLHRLAAQFGVQNWWEAWPAELSRGTRQKVALSIGLGLARPLTLLDEPFGTLDTASRLVLLDALRERAAAGGLVIVTTHGGELADMERRTLDIRAGELTEA